MTGQQTPFSDSDDLQPPINDEDESVVIIDAIEAVEKVGEISPAILIAGVIIALLSFILIVGGVIFLIINGGLGFIPTFRSEPLAIDFSDVDNSLWPTTLQAEYLGGSYQMRTLTTNQLYWSTAGIDLGLGEYEVDVSFQTETAESGAGIVFLLTGEMGAESFYLFEIDPSGYAWIGRCEQNCNVAIPLTGGGWYEVEAINQGAETVNRLKAVVSSTEMIFYVNGIEIGYVPNPQISGWGDVGLLIEASNEKEVIVSFDNFLWQPLEGQ